MSLTPLDESEKQPREGGPSADGGDDDGGLGILGRVRDLLGRVAAALSGESRAGQPTIESHETSTATGFDSRDRAPVAQSHAGSDARSAERSLTWAGGNGDPPEPDDPVDRPELVASWDDDGLTLSEPGDSSAAISSDTWTDVER